MKVLRILFLTPISWIWSLVSSIKNDLYEIGFFSQRKLPVPVLSVGNLTMGGVGKTPLVYELSKEFGKTMQVAIISRSYKGSLKQPSRVQYQEEGATKIYGDEAVLLARLNASLPVFSGPNKTETAIFALREMPSLQLLIVDDGFQHRKLFRQCDVLVLDATESFESYLCFPLGRARESWEHLDRASIFVITRGNLVSEETLMELLAQLPSEKSCFVTSIVPECLLEWSFIESRWSSVDFSLMKTLKPRLVTGLGRPQQFEMLVRQTFQEKFMMTSFPDHHDYRSEDFSFSEPALLTTEKDAVKMIAIKAPSLQRKRLFVLKTRYEWENGIEPVLQEMKKCLQKS